MKVLITSDLHIHPHKKSSERLQDCLNALDWLFATAIENKINKILFLGDLFHDRQRIDVPTYQKTFEIFEKYLSKGLFDIFLLLGNHDLWHFDKWDISSVFPLRSIKGVHVIDKPCTVNIDGFDVSFLPYTHDPASDLKLVNNDSEFKLLCGHVAIDGALWNSSGTTADVSIEQDGEMVKVDTSVFSGWDQVFLGHYHAQQKLKRNIEYVGSPLQLNFGEASQQKHIIIYDLEKHTKEYIINDFSPIHLIVSEKDLGKHNLKSNFLRVMVDDISKSEVIELRNDLQKKLVASLEIKQIDKKIEEQEMMIEGAKAILFNESEMLNKYIAQDKTIELDKDKLLGIGKLICGI